MMFTKENVHMLKRQMQVQSNVLYIHTCTHMYVSTQLYNYVVWRRKASCIHTKQLEGAFLCVQYRELVPPSSPLPPTLPQARAIW